MKITKLAMKVDRYIVKIFYKRFSKELNLDDKSMSFENYEPVSLIKFFYTLIILKFKVKPDNKLFVDIGSGLGFAIFLYSKFFNFKRIIGIEKNTYLYWQSKRNLPSNVTLINTDATEFKLPEGAGVILFFNPFDEIIMSKFLLNNKCFLNKKIVIFINDVCLGLFEDFFLNKIRSKLLRISILY